MFLSTPVMALKVRGRQLLHGLLRLLQNLVQYPPLGTLLPELLERGEKRWREGIAERDTPNGLQQW